MKTIKSLKDITTLEVCDVVMFGDLEYEVAHENGYYLTTMLYKNDKIFTNLNISKKDFVENLGIETLPINWVFPEVKSLEALTVIVSALFKEYEKQNKLTKTWEEFCERNPIKKGECWIECFDGKILGIADAGIEGKRRDTQMDKNICTSKQEAEAHLAFIQLRQLRKAYVKDWEPDWGCDYNNYCIIVCQQTLVIQPRSVVSHPFSFPTYKLAEQFFNNFKDLLEIAKPLL